MSALAKRSTETVDKIEFISKGQLTIPKHVREYYHIEPGVKGEIVSLSGAFLVVPHVSETPAIFDEIRLGLNTEEMSLVEMVAEMRRIRDSSDYEA